MLYIKSFFRMFTTQNSYCFQAFTIQNSFQIFTLMNTFPYYEHILRCKSCFTPKLFQTLTVRKAFPLKGNMYEHTG